MTVVLFIIILAILIFVHELGHFIVARKSGIRVDEFGLGFGPKIYGKKIGQTEYTLNLIPFGGFVKIFGENPDEDSINGPDKTRSFVNKPRPIQAAVLVAGVVFNFLFAWLLVSLGFMGGIPASADDYASYGDKLHDVHIAFVSVSPGSPADKAGLKIGDTLLSVTRGTTTYDASAVGIAGIQDVIAQSKGEPITVKIVDALGSGDSELTKGQEKDITIKAEENIVPGKFAIGIAMDTVGILKLPVHLAVWEGARLTWHLMKATAVGIYDLLYGVFHGTASLAAVSGPVGIAGLVGDASRLGFTYLMLFTALISINLGVLNLVPFPALDGGRLLFVIIESIIRKPIKPSVANAVNAVGFVILILLMLVVTYRDIVKLIVK